MQSNSNTPMGHTISVASGSPDIELASVNIETSGRAFTLGPGADVTLLLSGINSMESGGYAGIEVPSGASLTIGKAADSDADSADTLTAAADAGGTQASVAAATAEHAAA